jgi:hypothetical protein
VFVVIAGFIGFISYTGITKTLRKTILKHNKHFSGQVRQQNILFSKKLRRIEQDSLITTYNTDRSLYQVTKKRDIPAFQWAMSADSNSMLLDDASQERLYFWLDVAMKHLIKIEVGNLNDIKNSKTFKALLKNIRAHCDEKALAVLVNIEDRLNHIYYSIPQPPEDIMKDNGT